MVIRGSFFQHVAVRDVYDPAGALLRFNPVSDLDQAELKQPQVYYVSLGLSYLYPVSYYEGFSPEYEKPPRDVGDGFVKRYRDARTDDTQVGAYGAETLYPHAAEQYYEEKSVAVPNNAFGVIDGLGIFRVLGYEGYENLSDEEQNCHYQNRQHQVFYLRVVGVMIFLEVIY